MRLVQSVLGQWTGAVHDWLDQRAGLARTGPTDQPSPGSPVGESGAATAWSTQERGREDARHKIPGADQGGLLVRGSRWITSRRAPVRQRRLSRPPCDSRPHGCVMVAPPCWARSGRPHGPRAGLHRGGPSLSGSRRPWRGRSSILTGAGPSAVSFAELYGSPASFVGGETGLAQVERDGVPVPGTAPTERGRSCPGTGVVLRWNRSGGPRTRSRQLACSQGGPRHGRYWAAGDLHGPDARAAVRLNSVGSGKRGAQHHDP